MMLFTALCTLPAFHTHSQNHMRADPYLSTKKQIYVQYINVYCIYVQYTKILRSGGCMHRSWMVMGHSDHVFKIRVQTVLNPDHYISCARVASATWATYMREGYNTRWCNCGQHDSVLQRIYIYTYPCIYITKNYLIREYKEIITYMTCVTCMAYECTVQMQA